MPKHTAPDTVGLELVDAGVQAAIVVHADFHHEELVVLFHQEEVSPAVAAELVLVVLAERDDLVLRERERVEIFPEGSEELCERSIRVEFENRGIGVGRVASLLHETPVLEVSVDTPGEHFFGVSDEALASGHRNGDAGVVVEATEVGVRDGRFLLAVLRDYFGFTPENREEPRHHVTHRHRFEVSTGVSGFSGCQLDLAGKSNIEHEIFAHRCKYLTMFL